MRVDPVRRRRRITYGVAGSVVLGVIAASAGTMLVTRAQEPSQPLASYGVPATEAGCRPTVVDAAYGADSVVGPGTGAPDAVPVGYATVPPSSGPHWPVPVYPNLAFYSVWDVPRVEQLVHNLAHGYTVLWYDSGLSEDAIEQVRGLATRVRLDEPKFIAAPWDAARGSLPAGATVALTHWGAENGYRQLCTRLSGEAVAAFLAAHPATDAPEPDGA